MTTIHARQLQQYTRPNQQQLHTRQLLSYMSCKISGHFQVIATAPCKGPVQVRVPRLKLHHLDGKSAPACAISMYPATNSSVELKLRKSPKCDSLGLPTAKGTGGFS